MLAADGRRLVVNGQTVDDPAEQLGVLTGMEQRFANDLLPRLERLGGLGPR